MPLTLMRAWPAVALLSLAACGGGTGPVTLDTHGAEVCASCRMSITSTKTAAQLVAPGEEPVFFDDLGCLRDYLGSHATPAPAVTYIADHRTGTWVPGAEAVYARVPGVSTPMASHLLAWASDASRDADQVARGAEAVDAAVVIRAQGDPR